MRIGKVLAAASLALAVCCGAAFGQTAAPSPTPAPDLATAHAQGPKLACAACHGEAAPTSLSAEDSLARANRNCINCHGDAKSLAVRLAPKLVNKEINPHQSHLVEIDCVTCHRGHAAAEAYCQQCHAFDMTMPPKAKK